MGLIKDIDHSEFLRLLYRKCQHQTDYFIAQQTQKLLREYEDELNMALADEAFPGDEPEKAILR